MTPAGHDSDAGVEAAAPGPGEPVTASAGEMWDRRFAEQPWPSVPDPYLVEFAGLLPPGRGLDLGAGPGRNSLWLAARGWDMTLVDISRVALDQATAAAKGRPAGTHTRPAGTHTRPTAHTPARPITTVHADVLAWQPEESRFDLVIVANLHPGPDALAAVLARGARALRPGGHLYVVGHHVATLGRHGPPDPDRLLTADRLRSALPETLSVEVLDTRHRAADHGDPAGDPAGHPAGHPDGQPAGDTVVLAWATRPATPGADRR